MLLNNIWYVLIGIVFTIYIILDGYDLGIGILNRLLGKTDEERKQLYYSIGPFWDGNEVWLLTGGGALFAAFPTVYASVFSGFYLAIIMLLFFMILRIVAIEFRNKLENEKDRLFFDNIFMISSLLIVLILGIALGNIVQGLELIDGKNYYGGFWGLINPYSIFIGIFAVTVVTMQGLAYAKLKFEGEIYNRAVNLNKYIIFINLFLYIIGIILTSLFARQRLTNYLENPALFILLVFPILFLGILYISHRKESPNLNFLMSSLFIIGIMAIFGVGNYPYFVPSLSGDGGLDIYNSASTQATLRNMLIITLIGLPVVILYTIYVHKIFGGNVKEGENLY